MAALTLMFFLSSCGTDGGPDSIFQSGGFSGGGGGSVGLTSSGASVSPGSPSFCPGSDPSDNIPVDIPQKNGNTWVMAKTRLGTITKYNIYNSLTNYYTDRSTQTQTQMALQSGLPGVAGGLISGAASSLLLPSTPVTPFPGAYGNMGGMGTPGGAPFQGGGYPGGNQGGYSGGYSGGFQGGGGMPQMDPQMMQYQQQAYMQQQGMMQGQAMVQQTINQLQQRGYTAQQIIDHLTQQENQYKEDAEEKEKKLEEEEQQEKILKENNQECSKELEQLQKKLKEVEDDKENFKAKLREFVAFIPTEKGEKPIDALKRIFKEHGIEPREEDPEEQGSIIEDEEDLKIEHSTEQFSPSHLLPEPSAPPLDDLEQLEREEDSEEEEEVGDLEGKSNNWVFYPRRSPKKLTEEQSEQLQVLREARAIFLEDRGKPTTLPFKLTREQEWAYLVKMFAQLQGVAERNGLLINNSDEKILPSLSSEVHTVNQPQKK